MFWLDRIYGQIEEQLGEKIKRGETLLIRDEKTASGRVHVGSMRALALHAAIAERLAEAGVPHEFRFEINDFDPMDGLPIYLDKEAYEPYMGMQLYKIPAPDLATGKVGGSAKNFAECFAEEYIGAIEVAGFKPTFYRGSELYLSGKMNDAIRTFLDKADIVREVYGEMYGTPRPEDWFPLQVVCEQCGKIGTTRVTGWDGKLVTYRCMPKMVEWAEGCGNEGNISPFDGNAKLPWKAEWAAKWQVLGVDIEGGGKDHFTKGGSRDLARLFAQRVLEYPEPFGVANEFFLVGGKKMSSSKGAGVSARDIVELVPQHIFKLALYGKDINQQINFDPEGDTIPVLFDQYDKLAASYWAGVEDDYARLFTYIHPTVDEKPQMPSEHFLPRFSQVAFIAQMPHLDFFAEMEALKGSPLTEDDKLEASERREYALRWVRLYAPEKFVFELQDEVPDVALGLSEQQKNALKKLHDTLMSAEALPSGEELHELLHSIKDEQGIAPAELFSALYLAFLGKPFGPKAGWFLSVLERDFVLRRLEAVTQ
jgi:lysyl-tRNA synthetase class 1